MSNSPIWKDTTARVDTLMRFSDDQNYDLKGDLSWEVYGDTFHLKEQDSKLCS